MVQYSSLNVFKAAFLTIFALDKTQFANLACLYFRNEN